VVTVVYRMSISKHSSLVWLLLSGASGVLVVGVCNATIMSTNAGQDLISRAGSWHDANMHGKPCDSVTDAYGPGFVDPNCVASIGVPGRGNVPALHAVWCPAAMCIRLDMGQHACAGQGNGHVV